MKTNIKFGMRNVDIEAAVLSILPLADRQSDSVTAVIEAFVCADRLACCGVSARGEYVCGEYRAEANISAGEFKLYKIVIS